MYRLLPLAALALALVSCSGGEDGNEQGGNQANAPAPAPTGPAPRTPVLNIPPQPRGTPSWLDLSSAPHDAVAVDDPVSNAPAPAPTTEIAPQLQPLRFADLRRVGLIGQGCAWRRRGGREALFVAVGDRAAYRMGDRVVVIDAEAGARRLPFGTRARYRGKLIGFVVTPAGANRRSGPETAAQPATLAVGADGIDPTPIAGTLTCGT